MTVKPVPMSLDRDASDRTFDRQLAYLGLLDDAAPLFRDGCSIPAVGVLLALPCLVDSGLLRISRKLYGEIVQLPEHASYRGEFAAWPEQVSFFLAWLSFAPPTCRMPLGQSQCIPQAYPGGRVSPRF